MADEITATTGLKVSNGELVVSNPTKSKQFDQAAANARGGGPGTVDIGTAEESVSFGDIAPGFIEMRNLDVTNFVDYGTVAGNLGFQLLANGGPGLVYLKSGDTLYMKADTATCKVQINGVNS